MKCYKSEYLDELCLDLAPELCNISVTIEFVTHLNRTVYSGMNIRYFFVFKYILTSLNSKQSMKKVGRQL